MSHAHATRDTQAGARGEKRGRSRGCRSSLTAFSTFPGSGVKKKAESGKVLFGEGTRHAWSAHLDLGRLEGGDGAGEGGSDASHFERSDLLLGVV